jgi:nucleoside-diphosphate-sugar epimerase
MITVDCTRNDKIGKYFLLSSSSDSKRESPPFTSGAPHGQSVLATRNGREVNIRSYGRDAIRGCKLAVREQQYPVIGSGSGVFSFVRVEDAAAATVAALEADPGVYNIVDDDPSEMSVWLPAFALFLGAPAPAQISEQDALRTAGAGSIYYATRLRGASNGRAKQRLGFAPRRLEWLSKTKAALVATRREAVPFAESKGTG